MSQKWLFPLRYVINIQNTLEQSKDYLLLIAISTTTWQGVFLIDRNNPFWLWLNALLAFASVIYSQLWQRFKVDFEADIILE
jgi:hypothetical protein